MIIVNSIVDNNNVSSVLSGNWVIVTHTEGAETRTMLDNILCGIMYRFSSMYSMYSTYLSMYTRSHTARNTSSLHTSW